MALILELVNCQGTAPAVPTTKVFGARGGTLGRAAESSWILPDPEKYISGTHAVISHDNGVYYLEDTSTNGVFINNTDEPLGKGCKVALKDGDQLYIGEYQISVYIAEEQTKTADRNLVEPSLEGDDYLVDNHARDDDIDRVSKRHKSYLDNKFDDHRGDSEATPDHEVLDGLIEDPEVRPKEVSVLRRSDQPQQENADNRAGALVFDKPNLRETLTVEVPEQATSSPWSTDQVIFDEELQEPDLKRHGSEDQNSDDWHEPIFNEDSQSADTAGKVFPPRRAVPATAMNELASSEALDETPLDQPLRETDPRSENARVMNAFLKGLGLKKTLPSTLDPEETMELVGVTFRELIQGLMDILMVRASLKKEFRMTATTVHPIENNPLKFAMSVDEALPYLLLEHSSGFLPAVEAIREGFQDVQDHHWAIMVAMQAAFEDLLKQFDPELLEERFAKDSKLGSLRKVNKMFRNWDSYRQHYESLTMDAHSSFQRLFGERFVRAYEDQIQRLSEARKRTSD